MTVIIVIICGVNFVSGNLSNRYDVKPKIKSRSLDALDALGALYNRGARAGTAGTAAAGPMLEAKLMNLIKGRLQKF